MIAGLYGVLIGLAAADDVEVAVAAAQVVYEGLGSAVGLEIYKVAQLVERPHVRGLDAHQLVVNELLWRLRKEKTSAVSTPRTIAVAMQARKEKSVIAGEIRLLNTGYHSVYVFLKDIVSVADAVF